jgi:hypothetical protein
MKKIVDMKKIFHMLWRFTGKQLISNRDETVAAAG